jgi:hypothetical protein
MDLENEWSLSRGDRGVRFGAGMLRVALLFGSVAIALALILTPMLDGSDDSYVAQSGYSDGLDFTSTGSVNRPSRYRGEYTIRRSVLQTSPDSVCVIRDNGTKSGDC